MKKRKISMILATAITLGTLVNISPKEVYSIDSNSEAKSIVSEMTLEQKIGQMLMPDFRKWQLTGETEESDMTVLNDEIREIIEKYNFGGVILFAQNVKGTEQTTRLVDDLQNVAINDEDNLPLFITIDQEGGIVTRLGTGTNLPGNMALGATKNLESAYNAGAVIGEELASLGINVNFAPSMDVNNNPNNPVINLRSISSNPDLVGEMGSSIAKGIQDQGVSAALKHFAGHGDTATDSHYGLPVVDKSIDELMENELKPFKIGIEQGVDMVMTAHIQFPQIEKDTWTSKLDGEEIFYPATLSDDIISGVLREKLGYDGVVITDALNMEAISENFGEVDTVKEVIKAGVDIALMPTILRSKEDVSKLEDIVNGVKEAVESGEIKIEEIDDSVERIVKLKIDRGILNTGNDDKTIEEKIENAEAIVGSDEHRKIEREISAEAITIVKNENNLLPLKPKEGDKILMLAPYSNELPGMQFGLKRLMYEEKINNVEYKALCYNKLDELTEEAKAEIESADEIIIISEISRASHLDPEIWLTKYIDAVIEYAKKIDKEVIVASIGHPYDVTAREDAAAKVIAYGYKGMDPTEADGGLSPEKAFGPNIPAIIDVVFGAYEATGTLPVDIPELVYEDGAYKYGEKIKYAYGEGITDLLKTGKVEFGKIETIKAGETFELEINLKEIEKNLNSKNISFDVKLDKERLDIKDISTNSKSTDVSIKENEDGTFKVELVSKKGAITKETIKVEINALKDGKASFAIENINILDEDERSFTTENVSTEINIGKDKAPIIEATDKKIVQGTKFEPLKGVTAKDEEDGDLTDKLVVVENNIDTNTPGEYIVKYQVKDSFGNVVEKDIKVTVTKKGAESGNNDNDEDKEENLPQTGGATGLLAGVIALIGGACLRRKRSK